MVKNAVSDILAQHYDENNNCNVWKQCLHSIDLTTLNGDDTTENESFEIGGLEWPLYTRPSVWRGRSVPEVLLSGHHGNIERWRKQQSDELTKERRPDLIKEK